MSRENVEVVRKLYAASGDRDADTVLALYDPEVEFDYTRGGVEAVMGREVYRGHEGLRRWFRAWYEVFEDVEHALDDVIDMGDEVVTVARTRGRGRRSRAEVEWTHTGVWTIRKGKIARVMWFPSREEALEAVGLPE